MSTSGSGIGGRGPGDVLRLLPFVHHPPARVALPAPGDGHVARALDARGYRVTVYGQAAGPGITQVEAEFTRSPSGEFDLVCETGGYTSALDRDAYVEACARALRPGGLCFGVYPGSAAELLHRYSGRFDSARLDPGAGREGWFEAVFVRR